MPLGGPRHPCPEVDFGQHGALTETLRRLADAATEQIAIALFDEERRFMCWFTRPGIAASAELNYRSLIERILVNRANGLLVAHNHPSGDPTPSARDIRSTRDLAALCRPLDIRLHDHLVVGGDRVVSMRAAGLFQ